MTAILLLAIVGTAALAAEPEPKGADDWWNAAWSHRKRVRVSLPAMEPMGWGWRAPAEQGDEIVPAQAMLRTETPLEAGAQREVRVVDAGGNVLPAVVSGPDSRGLVHVVFPARRTIAGTLAGSIVKGTATVALSVGRDKGVTPGTRFQVMVDSQSAATLEVVAVAEKTATARVVETKVPRIGQGAPVRSGTIAGTLAGPIVKATETVALSVGRDKAVTPGLRFEVVGADRAVAQLEVQAVEAKTSTARVLETSVPQIAQGTAVQSQTLTDAEYFIYYGNPKAAEAGPAWTPPSSAVRRYTWRITGGGPPTTVEALRQQMRHNVELAGADSLAQMSSRGNPQATGEETFYIAAYESHCRVELGGLYRFSLDTYGPSFVFIDGGLAAQRQGFFMQTGQWEHRGKIALEAGYHHLVMFAVEKGGQRVSRLGWQPSTAKVYGPTPASFYVTHVGGDAVGYDTREARGLPFFTCSLAPRSIHLDPTLRPQDIVDWAGLCKKLVAAAQGPDTTPGSRFWAFLPEEGRKRVSEVAGGAELDDARKAAMVDQLNALLRQPGVYISGNFTEVALPVETADLAARSRSSGESRELVVRLNRVLLQATFPEEVARSPRYQFVQFHNHTPAAGGGGAAEIEWQWAFPGDERDRDRAPGRLFAVPRPGEPPHIPVVLEALVGGKPIGKYERVVHLDYHPVQRLALSLDIVSFANIVYDDERTSIAVRLRNANLSPLVLRAVGRLESGGKSEIILRRLVHIGAENEDFCILPIDMKQLDPKRATVELGFDLAGQEVRRTAMRIVPSPEGLAGLRRGLGALFDDGERRVMICAEIEDRDRHLRWVFYNYLRDEVIPRSRKTRTRVLLFGDRMANPVRPDQSFTDYVALLDARLKADGRQLTFAERSVGLLPTLADLILFAKTVGELETFPDILVLSPGLADVVQASGERDVTRSIDVLIDVVRQRAPRTKIVVVSPPPYPGNPRLSKHYTEALAKLAREHHYPFLDLHRLLIARDDQDWVKDWYAAPDADGIFLANPNEQAHKRIAEALAKLIY